MRDASLEPRKLRILHVFRAPLGGLFRHVVDLAGEQAARGHEVGLFFDTPARGEQVDARAGAPRRRLAPRRRGCPIHRNPHPSDALRARAFHRDGSRESSPTSCMATARRAALYARLPGSCVPSHGPVRAYTPHGGSFNYRPGSAVAPRLHGDREAAGAVDRRLPVRKRLHRRRVSTPMSAPSTRSGAIVANGIGAGRIRARRAQRRRGRFPLCRRAARRQGHRHAARRARARRRERSAPIPRAVLVGSGPDRTCCSRMRSRLGVAPSGSSFPARCRRARLPARPHLVVPSRAESLPYIVLEAAGARMPLIATDVGGIPEIFGPYRDRLGPSDDPADSARACCAMLSRPRAERDGSAARTRAPMSQATFLDRDDGRCRAWRLREAIARARADARTAPRLLQHAVERLRTNHGRIFRTRHATGRSAPRRAAPRVASDAAPNSRCCAASPPKPIKCRPIRRSCSPVWSRAVEFLLIALTGAARPLLLCRRAASATSRAISS